MDAKLLVDGFLRRILLVVVLLALGQVPYETILPSKLPPIIDEPIPKDVPLSMHRLELSGSSGPAGRKKAERIPETKKGSTGRKGFWVILGISNAVDKNDP